MIGTLATVYGCGSVSNMASELTFGRVAEWSIATVLKTVHREHSYTPKTSQNSAEVGCFCRAATHAKRANCQQASGTNRRVSRHTPKPYPETRKAPLGSNRTRPDHQRRSA